MGIVTDAPSGQTNFMGFTHAQLLQMFGAASPTHAFEASLKLGTASQMLTQAAEELASGIHNLDWDGDAAERFRVWADQLVVTTHHLAEYSGDVGATLLDVAVGIGSTKLPPVPTEDLELVDGFAKNPGALSAVATISPAEAGTLTADLDRAKANIENQRIEAAAQMRKLAMGYESAAERMAALTPPVFPEAPNLYSVEHVTWRPIDGPGDGPSGSGDDAPPPVARGVDGVALGAAPGNGATVAAPRGDVPAVAPASPIVTVSASGADPAVHPPRPTDVWLAGAATLAPPQAGPPAAPPVTGVGTGGTSGTALVAPIVGVPSPVSGSPGKASSGAGVNPRPGSGTAGLSPGPPGGAPIRPMTTTGPTGTFGGKPVSQGLPARIPGSPTVVGGASNPRPYGRPGTPAITGGQGVPGSAAPRGGTRTGPVRGGVPAHPARRGTGGTSGTGSGAVGNRAFSPGGSGIRRATGGRTPVSATDGGPPGRGPTTSGFGPASVPSDERRRRGSSRADYGDEEEEGPAAEKPPVPPVVG